MFSCNLLPALFLPNVRDLFRATEGTETEIRVSTEKSCPRRKEKNHPLFLPGLEHGPRPFVDDFVALPLDHAEVALYCMCTVISQLTWISDCKSEPYQMVQRVSNKLALVLNVCVKLFHN